MMLNPRVQHTLLSISENHTRLENDTAVAPAATMSLDPTETVRAPPATFQIPDEPYAYTGRDGEDDPLTPTEPLPETPPPNLSGSLKFGVIIGAAIAVSILMFAVGPFGLGCLSSVSMWPQACSLIFRSFLLSSASPA